ncbi:MAG: SEL1-like repeat protein [Clostridia bacterium]|nr:SEL1-like repeat protein [Clostridia bacterium]
MKKIMLFALTLCLFCTVFGGAAFVENAAAEVPAAEKPASEMTPEELYQAGNTACDAADYEKAIEYWQLAADAGHPEGWRSIGALYANGEGVEMDLDRALEYFQMSADRGDAKAFNNMGTMYMFGMGVEQDAGKAVEYYQKAGELGFAEAYTMLASYYQFGEGVEQDIGKAVEYYQKAADLGDASVCYSLGDMYFSGEGVERDYGKAAEYYQKAADLGIVQALCDLGNLYYSGKGIEQDYGRAVACFTQAAEQGEPEAMFMLGDCCRLGQGLEKDAAKAAEWYRKALEAGYDPDEEALEMLKAALGDDYYAFFPAPEEGKDYFVRTAGVLTGKEQTGSMDLRFYTSAPHVPYYGLKAYVDFMYQTGLTVTPLDGGVWEVSNPNGTKILANPSAGTIEASDWARFQIPPLPCTTMAGIKDTACGWTYYSDVVFDGPPAPVTFDFAKYGIPVYADEEDVYLPLELLSTMFTDVACNYVLWNGESVLKPAMNINQINLMPLEWYESRYMRDLLTGEKRREEDVIREDYAELCFTLDYFYGHPGTGILDRGIGEKGLDAALDDVPELASVKDRLKDPDMLEYMLALFDLVNIGLNEGHTMYFGLNAMAVPDFPYPEIMRKIGTRVDSQLQVRSNFLNEIANAARKARTAAWGNDVYRECGSTAIIRIDEFHDDAAGWEAYYAGKGEIPMDAVGIVWTGLKKASENPSIKNILFDLSANAGGSNDMLAYMIDLMFGDNVFRGYNGLTEQREYAVVHSDKNLDGAFDEKDDEVKYDFNYAVLTTRAAFSCGNLMPILMQEHGAVLLGEPTGGGTCCIQISTLASGGEYMMSSWLWALRDAKGESVEGGCKTDLPIARIEPETPTHEDPRLSSGDYTPFFDDVMLDRMINEWFEEQALAPAA